MIRKCVYGKGVEFYYKDFLRDVSKLNYVFKFLEFKKDKVIFN